MAEYTIVLQAGEDPQTVSAIVEGATFTEAKDLAFGLFAHAGSPRGYAAIGRGRDDRVEWIGAFDFEPGAEPRWEADS